ncbi:MAG TPA: ATP-binding cassette domain-containing protein [Candidatus Dormibacteraeota bacterium]|nr:ATP-binding cassette domain-containing protein [Candidatus Dormibacteraeota bacterium]
MATVLDESGESGGSRKGRRRRAAARAAAQALTEATAAGLAEAIAAELPEGAPPIPEAGNGARGRKKSLRLPANGHAAQASPAAEAAVVAVLPDLDRTPADALEVPGQGVLVETPPAAVDEFRDLLGQAVGLRLDSVHREFGGGHDTRVTALRNVSLEIGPCEFVAIMGPSGCGKTTLLSLMGGLDRPTSGRVFGAGLPLGELPERALADYRLQRVSTIFQTFNLIPSMTVEDNVALPLTLAGVPLEERRRRARHLLALVGLEERSRTRASRLSGGEQQKVAVARALANRPGLILADEPTGSLDSAAGEGVLHLLDDLNRRGATVVLVTHDPEVARHATRVVRMIDGNAIELESGKPTVRGQEAVDPAPRMHWRDHLKLGLGSAGRRPLRTSLTTSGVAIGIAALSLIVALAGGLQQALDAPALATSQVHQVAVYPVADAVSPSFDAPTLTTLAALPHVRAAWGQVGLTGSFGPPPAAAPSAAPTTGPAASHPGELVSLPPMGSSSVLPLIQAGRLPSSDGSAQILLTDSEARALGYTSPQAAIGRYVIFTDSYGTLGTRNPSSAQVPLSLAVVGIVSTEYMPAGAPGGLVPYQMMRTYWSNLARQNGWRSGEFSGITLLADSGLAVEGLRSRVEALGFQAQTFGDQFRHFEDLLGKLRIALLGLVVVALLLACLGIANTMYSAVLERTKEIGVLKALGARSRDVLLLFVVEAAGIGLAGGVLGALVAVALSRLGNAAVDRLTQSIGSSAFDVFQTALPLGVAAVALAVLLSTISGLLPALRAARQDPVKALHHE